MACAVIFRTFSTLRSANQHRQRPFSGKASAPPGVTVRQGVIVTEEFENDIDAVNVFYRYVSTFPLGIDAKFRFGAAQPSINGAMSPVSGMLPATKQGGTACVRKTSLPTSAGLIPGRNTC
ncbi:hypothetical protein [Acidisphaera sp. S103]|uniref:hypothetical protein n=1 Tax=Acidisphaera sp. S103 TaxID=1747223 RepID=UPI00131AD28B|nr:hypothetical protein [Acidisphaera sp. S103]